MATNKKKVLITQSLSPSGRALIKERGDIVTVDFLNSISTPDFQALIAREAPINAVALGATPFGPRELEASREMLVVARIGVGFDAVDVPALTARKIPLMVAAWTPPVAAIMLAVGLLLHLEDG